MNEKILKIVNEILDSSNDLANKHKELKHWTVGLAELLINHMANGDQEQKNLLWLQLEENMKKSKRGEL